MIRVKQILSPGVGGQPAARDGHPHSNAHVSLHTEGRHPERKLPDLQHSALRLLKAFPAP